jgi:hypothetical protein
VERFRKYFEWHYFCINIQLYTLTKYYKKLANILIKKHVNNQNIKMASKMHIFKLE